MVDIGQPERVIEIVPVEDPVPAKEAEPVVAPEEVPEEVPA